MYINPFVAGMITVLLIEAVGLFVYGIVLKRREDNDGEEK